ncbi:MAG TPA: DUF1573 domain-containing protein [Gemmataceae bacterium]|nr:DUF1573 domain-containing protein [Gemmataceae bacterium]
MFATLALAFALTAPPEPLQIEQRVIEAGEVKIGPSLTRRFAFDNAAREPLTVTDLKASCGCATPTLAQRTYQPGERGELSLEVNTLSQPAGPHRWPLVVSYKCGNQTAAVTVELTARLVQEIEVTPAAVAFQGVASAVVTVRDRRPRPLRLQCAHASLPFLLATVEGNASVRVVVASDCPDGRHAATVTIATDDPTYREIKLPVTIVREPRQILTASPARVTLVAGGSALVQLRDATGASVQVESAEPSHAALTARWATGPVHFATLRIALDRTRWDGRDLSAEVRVKANGQTLTIPVAVGAKE